MFDPYTGLYNNTSIPSIPQVYPRVSYPTNQNSIKWVQGEAGARAQEVRPGESGIFLDSESPCFYIKTVDASGMPMPLRIFDYSERVPIGPQEQKEVDLSNYITREEFEKKIASLMNQRAAKGGKNNAESAV